MVKMLLERPELAYEMAEAIRAFDRPQAAQRMATELLSELA